MTQVNPINLKRDVFNIKHAKDKPKERVSMNYKEPVIPMYVEKGKHNYVYQEAKAIAGPKAIYIDP